MRLCRGWAAATALAAAQLATTFAATPTAPAGLGRNPSGGDNGLGRDPSLDNAQNRVRSGPLAVVVGASDSARERE